MKLILRSRLYCCDYIEEYKSIKKSYLSKIRLYYQSKMKYLESEFCYVIEVEISDISDILKIANLLDNDLILRKERCTDYVLFMDIYDTYVE